MAVKMAVVMQKGGAGKTTVVRNLAPILADNGRSVLVIDLDSQRTLTKGFDLPAAEKTIHDVLVYGEPITRALVSWRGVDFVHGSPAMSSLEKDFVGTEFEHTGVFRLRDSLAPVEARYDFVLMDCPPAFQLETWNALAVADWCLVPMDASCEAYDSLPETIRDIQKAQRGVNKNLEILGLFPTKFRRKGRVEEGVVGAVREEAQWMIFEPAPQSASVPQAYAKRLPVVDYDREASAAFERVAEYLLSRFPMATATTA